LENFKKGNEQKTFKDIMSDKFYWTFQVEKLGDLVKKDRDNKSDHLQIQLKVKEQSILVTFSDSASKNIGAVSELIKAQYGFRGLMQPGAAQANVTVVFRVPSRCGQTRRNQDSSVTSPEKYRDAAVARNEAVTKNLPWC